MRATVIPLVIGALGRVTKGLTQGMKDLEIRGRVETIQTTALWRSARLETWGDLLPRFHTTDVNSSKKKKKRKLFHIKKADDIP